MLRVKSVKTKVGEQRPESSSQPPALKPPNA